MGLVVETGTVVTGANTYAAAATATTYHADRNNTTWAEASDEAQIAALLDAARYLDYGYRWLGTRRTATQSMAWPRFMVFLDADNRLVPSNSIPQRLIDAQCELALQALSGALMPTLDRGARESKIQVGPIDIEYFADAPGTPTYPVVDALIYDLVDHRIGGGVTAQAMRA